MNTRVHELFRGCLKSLVIVMTVCFSSNTVLGMDSVLGIGGMVSISRHGAQIQVGQTPIEGSVSIQTFFHTNEAWDSNDGKVAQLVLAGLATDPEAQNLGLKLSWASDLSGWFPRWVLSLSSETNWHPELALVGAKSKTADATDAVELAVVQPVGGHTYNTMLSYDRVTGQGNLLVVDTTSENLIFSGSFRTIKPTAPLYPIVGAGGSVIDGGTGLTQTVTSVNNNYLPVGTRWQLCSLSNANCISNSLFQTSDQPYLEVTAPLLPQDGEYRVWVENAGKRDLLATVKGAPLTTVRLPLAPLPIGQNTVSLEYESTGQALWADSRTVVNGSVELIPGDVAVNREQQIVSGSFRIKGEKLPAIPITVGATLHKMVWDQKSLSYSELPYQDLEVFSGTVVPAQWPDPILYSFKMPNEEGLYKITLVAESDAGVAVRKTDEARQFNTYLPANVVIRLSI